MSSESFGEIGIWLLIAAGAVIVVEGAIAAILSARVAVQARTLAVTMEREQGAIRADVERLRLALEETKRLWQPFARILRWLNHPLVIALFESYRRRRAAR